MVLATAVSQRAEGRHVATKCLCATHGTCFAANGSSDSPDGYGVRDGPLHPPGDVRLVAHGCSRTPDRWREAGPGDVQIAAANAL